MFVAEPESLTDAELEEELAAQAAHVDAGLCRFVELAAECERRLAWADEGTTFAAWLAWRCSLLPRQAREHERVALRLHELPLVHAAFARGEVSYAKVCAILRVAEPGNEAALLELAEVMTASQLERAVAAYRRITREEAAERQEMEFLTWFWAEDGSLLLESLEAARGALRERHGALEPGAGDAADARITNVEAFVAMADLALAGTGPDRNGGDRHQIVVHVDADGRCELADGAPLATDTALRLACDSSVVALHESGTQALSLGRKRRTVSPALRRALGVRDRGCRFPGCERTRFVDAHHVRHWSRGGETSLDNLVTLCRRHHRLVHERGNSVKVGNDGEARFADAQGDAIPNVPRSPPSHRDALADDNRRRRVHVDSSTCRNGTGDRMDLGCAVAAIGSLTL